MTDPTHWTYAIRPTRPAMLAEGPTEAEAAVVAAHFDYLERLMGQGVVILAGRTQTTDADSFGIIIFKAAGEAEARSVVDGDPAVRGGVMRATLYPYRIALLDAGNA
jgi:uncharacterized protein YciI